MNDGLGNRTGKIDESNRFVDRGNNFTCGLRFKDNDKAHRTISNFDKKNLFYRIESSFKTE